MRDSGVTVGEPDPEHRRSNNLQLGRGAPMTSDTSPRPISPLRARMIEDMTVRGFNEDTRRDYVRHVRAFAAFIGRSPDTATAPKYKAAFATAYGAGLRASEVVALKVGDVDSERMLLRVERGKGGKDRHAMLSPQLLKLLRVWWREGRRHSLLLPGGWLFPGRNPVEPLSARQLCRAVHAAAQAAGIKKHVSPHTLRHSFATHLLEQGVDIRVIQTLMGHAKLDTTALYTRVANTTIRAVTSPLDRLAPLIEGRPRPEA